MKKEEWMDEERVYAPPARFDATIGYWTGEPDEETLERAVESVSRDVPEVAATRCCLGHLHLRGPRAAVDAAEAAHLPAGLFRRVTDCVLRST
jgi:hypothetical protein